MSHEAFLSAILETPDDDAPRLVYSDWLEDNGDLARAEFIRLQCRFLQPDNADSAYLEAFPRLELLTEAYGPSWQPEIPAEVRANPCFRRGFVSVLERSCESFLQSPEEYDRFAPIDGLSFEWFDEEEDDLDALAAHPYFARLRWLLFGEMDSKVLLRLARSPHLSRLESLTLEDLGDPSTCLAAFAQASHPRLRDLLIPFNPGLNGKTLAQLLDSPGLPALRTLDLAYCNLQESDVKKLLNARGMAKMTALDLQGCDLSGEKLTPLLRSKHLTSMRSLSLACTRLRDAGASTLAGAKSLPVLDNLTLYDNGLTAPGIEAIALSRAFAGLRALSLQANAIGVKGAKALAASDTMTGLVYLHLDGCKIGDTGARALARWPGLANVRSLTLSNCKLTDIGVKALANSPHLSKLVYLDLDNNELGPDGAEALADSDLPRRLRRLDLNTCNLGSNGAKALARASWSEELAMLRLGENGIGDVGGRALANSTTLPGPTFFRPYVSGNAIRKKVRTMLEERFGMEPD